MRPRRSVLITTAALALTVGSVVPGLPGLPARASHTPPSPVFDLSVLPAPAATGPAIANEVARFSETFPLRITGSPTEVLAGQDIEAELKGLGYQTAIMSLPANAGAPDQPIIKVVTATKRGVSLPDEVVILGGHYDSMVGTINAAYDNGSGVAMLRHFARALATVPTNRTVTFAFFNGEEEGALASKRYVSVLQAAGTKVNAYLGFDMVGIAWPIGGTNAASCLCMWHGSGASSTALKPLLEAVNYSFLKFPKGARQVSIEGPNVRNSDEASFAGPYKTLRWAGMKTASSYPEYHKPQDNMAAIDTVAGGRQYFEEGILNTLKSAYYTLLAMDNHAPTLTLTAATSGRSVTVSAVSSDADGTSPVTVSFGDGNSATGTSVEHTYAAPGTYTVTATATDNLWSAVTTTRTTTVTVS